MTADRAGTVFAEDPEVVAWMRALVSASSALLDASSPAEQAALVSTIHAASGEILNRFNEIVTEIVMGEKPA